MTRYRREIIRGAVTFTLLVIFGALPSENVRSSFGQGVTHVCNLVFSEMTFPGGIRAELSPIFPNETSFAQQNVAEDTRLVLHTGHGTSASLGLSLRRDAYLPLVMFLAATIALPITRWEKAACVGVGVPVVIAAAVASIGLLVSAMTSRLPGVGAGDIERSFSAFMFERWLTPPGNRVIAPLALAGVLGLFVHHDFSRTSRS